VVVAGWDSSVVVLFVALGHLYGKEDAGGQVCACVWLDVCISRCSLRLSQWLHSYSSLLE